MKSQHEARSIFPLLDLIPRDWGRIRIKQAAKVFAGGTPNREKGEFWDGGTIPWLNSGEVNQWLIERPSELISEKGFSASSARWIPAGALVLALAGQGKTKGMVARLAISATCNQSMAAIVPDGRLDASYLQWWLHANYEVIRNLAGGEQRDGLNLEIVGNIFVPLPDVETQKVIGDVLNRATARIDALVRAKNQLIGLLAEKRKAIIATAVTRGLDPKVKLRDSGVPWMGDIPAHWEVWRSKRLFCHRNEKADVGSTPLTVSQDYGVIPQSEFMEREGRRVVQVETGADILKKVMENDFVISMRSFQGGIELSRHAGAASSAYIVLVPSSKVFVPFFALLFKSTSYVQALRSTSSLVRDGQALRYENFTLVDLPLPPFDEQIRIAEIVELQIGKLLELAEATSRTIALLKERRSALIAAAVTGQLDVGAAA